MAYFSRVRSCPRGAPDEVTEPSKQTTDIMKQSSLAQQARSLSKDVCVAPAAASAALLLGAMACSFDLDKRSAPLADVGAQDGGGVDIDSAGEDLPHDADVGGLGDLGIGGFLPSNVGNRVALDSGLIALVVDLQADAWAFNTTTGAITHQDDRDSIGPGVEVRPPGEGLRAGIRFVRLPQQGDGAPSPLGVFSVGSLAVEEGALLLGIGDVPLVIVSGSDIEIGGIISVASARLRDRSSAGAGGRGLPAMRSVSGSIGSAGGGIGGGGPGRPDTNTSGGEIWGGGGGGSFCGTGGRGGHPTLGGAAGSPYGHASLVPLRGGSGGGGGVAAGAGGAGGGALQLIAANHLRVTPTGKIDASGSGGFNGTGFEINGAGGGGSGGAILLEALSVVIEGVVGASGGGGGATGAAGSRGGGANGAPDQHSAAGAVVAGGSPGGSGSDLSGEGQNAGAAPVDEGGGGGGGGGGRIRINTATAASYRDYESHILPRTPTCFSVGRVTPR